MNIPQSNRDSFWAWFGSVGPSYLVLLLVILVMFHAWWRSSPPLPRFAEGETVRIAGTNRLGQVRMARCQAGRAACEYDVRVDLTPHVFFEHELQPANVGGNRQ